MKREMTVKRFSILFIVMLIFFVAGCKAEEIDYECYSTPQPPPGDGPILSTPGLNLSLLEETGLIKQDEVITL